MSNRRRAQHRHTARHEPKQPVIIAGEGIVAAELGHRFEAKASAQLPPKDPGRHRWIATAAYVLTDLQVAGVTDPDLPKILDNENLWTLAIGCVDCEEPLGVIRLESRCPAPEYKP